MSSVVTSGTSIFEIDATWPPELVEVSLPWVTCNGVSVTGTLLEEITVKATFPHALVAGSAFNVVDKP